MPKPLFFSCRKSFFSSPVFSSHAANLAMNKGIFYSLIISPTASSPFSGALPAAFEKIFDVRPAPFLRINQNQSSLQVRHACAETPVKL